MLHTVFSLYFQKVLPMVFKLWKTIQSFTTQLHRNIPKNMNADLGTTIQTLILAPTRELCQQINKQIFKLTKYTQGVFSKAVYGGEKIELQINALRKPTQIIVATPGRLIDLLEIIFDLLLFALSSYSYIVSELLCETLNALYVVSSMISLLAL